MTLRFLFTLCCLNIAALADAQIYTHSQERAIPGTENIQLGPGVDLSNMTLRSADFQWSLSGRGRDMTGAKFDSAILDHAGLWALNLTDASFRAASLIGTQLDGTNLNDADFTNANLTDAIFDSIFRGTILTNAEIVGATFNNSPRESPGGPSEQQIASTASYQRGDLNGIRFSNQDLAGWDLSDQDLSRSTFRQTDLTNADLSGSNLSFVRFPNAKLFNANLADTAFADTVTAELHTGTIATYNQWTVFPQGFDPAGKRFVLVESTAGDTDGDGSLDIDDLDVIARRSMDPLFREWLPDEFFDVNLDGAIDSTDLRYWLTDLRKALPGDSDVNGVVDFQDFLSLSDSFGGTGSWQSGDFDFDGRVGFSDFLALSAAFGSSEIAAESNNTSVPEPNAKTVLALIACALLAKYRSRRDS